jgi:hypothetical protein
MDWFRSWHGAPTDTKWLVIARRAKTIPANAAYVFWALEDYASQHADRGSVKGFDVEVCATYSGIEEDTISAILAALREKGIITDADRLSAWEKRQPKREDDSTERVRLMRERERLEQLERELLERGATPEKQDVTQCNAMERDATQCNAPEQSRAEYINGTANAGADAPSADPLTTCLNQLQDPKTKNKNAPIGALFTARFGTGTRPDYGRLGKLAKELSGEHLTLARVIWKCGVPEGDAHDYLTKAVRASPAHLNGTRSRSPDEDRELARADGFQYVDEGGR